MKISGIRKITSAFFVSLLILFLASCSCYMKTDLGNESIDVSITRKKDASGNTGIILTFNEVSSELDIPDFLQGMPVIKIVFADATNLSSLTKITIPESVTEIDTFEKASITTVTLPKNLAYLPSFKGCTKLTAITIPTEITEIPDSCFEGCTSLTKITKKEAGDSNQNEETQPDTLKGIEAIGKRAFYECKALSSIALETTEIIVLNELSFYNCISLKKITLPATVEKIDDDAFNNCQILTTVNGFKNVKEVGKKVFYSCKLLDNIELNPEINKEEKQDENGNPKTTIKIPENLFNGCEKLSSITIPDGVTTLGSYIFANCKALTELNIPEGIETVSSNLCNGCSALTSLTLPSTLTKIDSSAIKGCNGLSKIVCKAGNPPLIDESNSLSTDVLTKDLIIYVPDESVANYKSETAWGKVFEFSEDTGNQNPSESETTETTDTTKNAVKIIIKGLSELQ